MKYSKVDKAQHVQWNIRVSKDTDRRTRAYLQGAKVMGRLVDMAVAEHLGRAEERERLARAQEAQGA